jgi:hypothetical protein
MWAQSLFGLGQTLIDLLTGEIDVGLVAEDGGDLGEAIARKRACVIEARRPRECRFDREGNLLFDFDGGERRSDAIDLDLVVGDIRNSERHSDD